MKLRHILTACVIFLGLSGLATAQVQKDEHSVSLVRNATIALFDLLPKNNFEAERALMADDLASISTLGKWKIVRKQVTKETGPIPKYIAYQTTYYEEEALLVAVDFYGRAAKPNVYVCGFVLWKVEENSKIGFTRLEENVINMSAVKSLTKQQVAQQMADWRCPIFLIEEALGIRLQ